MGFKVMLWICPYIRPDGQYFKELFLDEDEVVWLRSATNPRFPAIMQWWDGFSAVADLTNPHGRDWFKAQLDHLVEEYGVDGFKLDGGDAVHYTQARMLNGAVAFDSSATPTSRARPSPRSASTTRSTSTGPPGRWAASRWPSDCATRSTPGRTSGS